MKFKVLKNAGKRLSLLDFMIFAISVCSEYSEHHLQDYSVATSCSHVMQLNRDTVQSSLVQDCAITGVYIGVVYVRTLKLRTYVRTYVIMQ